MQKPVSETSAPVEPDPMFATSPFVVSKSLCLKVLHKLFGPTARFQTLHEGDSDKANGLRVIFVAQGQEVEVARAVRNDGNVGIDLRLPLALLQASARAIGAEVEAVSRKELVVRRMTVTPPEDGPKST